MGIFLIGLFLLSLSLFAEASVQTVRRKKIIGGKPVVGGDNLYGRRGFAALSAHIGGEIVQNTSMIRKKRLSMYGYEIFFMYLYTKEMINRILSPRIFGAPIVW